MAGASGRWSVDCKDLQPPEERAFRQYGEEACLSASQPFLVASRAPPTDHKQRLIEQLDESLLLFGGVPARLHKVPNDLPNRNQGATQTARWTQELSGDQTTHGLWAYAAENLRCFLNRVCQTRQQNHRFAIRALS